MLKGAHTHIGDWCVFLLSQQLLPIPGPKSHQNCCTFLVPLGLQEALRLEPSLSLHYMRHLRVVSAGCPGFTPLCSLRCCSVVWRSFCGSPRNVGVVVLCHSNIHSSAGASTSGDVVREEGRSGVGSGCMAGTATGLISTANPDNLCWEHLLGSTSPERAFSSWCFGFGSCWRSQINWR